MNISEALYEYNQLKSIESESDIYRFKISSNNGETNYLEMDSDIFELLKNQYYKSGFELFCTEMIFKIDTDISFLDFEYKIENKLGKSLTLNEVKIAKKIHSKFNV